MNQKLINFFFTQINPTLVSVFRIGFGMLMVYQMIYYFQIDYTQQFMTGPQLLFPYELTSALKPISSSMLRIINFGMLISAALVCIGFFYKYAITFFFISFTYFSFIDTTLFNNHIYLTSLIAFVLIFMDADKKYSVRSFLSKKENSTTIPAWNQYLLTFLIALPYFFGGIAKLTYNWIGTDLPKIIIEQSQSKLATYFSEAILANFLTYTGIAYDLSIVFLLVYKKTRWLGVILVVLFNITNHAILFNDIGFFPVLMIFSTILFFDASEVNSFFLHFRKNKKNAVPNKTGNSNNLNKSISPIGTSKKVMTIAILGFVLFQLIYPFRSIITSHNPEWTGIAARFTWRMKMQHKEIKSLKFTFANRETGAYGPVEVETFLTKNQLIHLADDPVNFIHLSHYLKSRIEKETQIKDPKISAEIKVEFNGLSEQYYFPPETDLTRVDKVAIKTASWLTPLATNDTP